VTSAVACVLVEQLFSTWGASIKFIDCSGKRACKNLRERHLLYPLHPPLCMISSLIVILDLHTCRKEVLVEILGKRVALPIVISILVSTKARTYHAGRWPFTCLSLRSDKPSCFRDKKGASTYRLVIGAIIFRSLRSRMSIKGVCAFAGCCQLCETPVL